MKEIGNLSGRQQASRVSKYAVMEGEEGLLANFLHQPLQFGVGQSAIPNGGHHLTQRLDAHISSDVQPACSGLLALVRAPCLLRWIRS